MIIGGGCEGGGVDDEENKNKIYFEFVFILNQ
jgi:hypothetical protein